MKESGMMSDGIVADNKFKWEDLTGQQAITSH
jgi:hypothetical protein